MKRQEGDCKRGGTLGVNKGGHIFEKFPLRFHLRYHNRHIRNLRYGAYPGRTDEHQDAVEARCRDLFDGCIR